MTMATGASPGPVDDRLLSKTLTALEDLSATVPKFVAKLQSREQLDEHQQVLVKHNGTIEQTGGMGEQVQIRVLERIGYGTFCVVFRGELLSGLPEGETKAVAMKFELRKTDSTQLRNEYRMYKRFASIPGIASVYGFGEVHFHKVLVMDLLGPSLETLFQECGRKFSTKTVATLAKQMLARIQAIHDGGIIYRDIKPENFLIDLPQAQPNRTVFLVDYGMAKIYRDPETKEHIPFGEAQSLSGTARYMSINAHSRRSQSRRDDLEALGHVFMYFLRGNLPWQGIKAAEHDQRYEMMCTKKQATTIEDLCAGYPSQFAEYLVYSRQLTFDGDPDYAYLQGLFDQVLADLGEVDDGVYEWTTPAGSERAAAAVDAVQSQPAAPAADRAETPEAQEGTPDMISPSSPPGKRRRSEFASDLKPPTHIRPKKSYFLFYDSDAQKALVTLYREVMAKRYSFHRAVGRGTRPGMSSAAAVAAAAAAAAALAAADAGVGVGGPEIHGGSPRSYGRPRTPLRIGGAAGGGAIIAPAFSATLDKTLGAIITELEDLSDKLLQGGDWSGVLRVRRWFDEAAAALKQETQRIQRIQQKQREQKKQQQEQEQKTVDEMISPPASPGSALEVPQPGMHALSLEVDRTPAVTDGSPIVAVSDGPIAVGNSGGGGGGEGEGEGGGEGDDDTFTLVYRTASGTRRVVRMAGDKPA